MDNNHPNNNDSVNNDDNLNEQSEGIGVPSRLPDVENPEVDTTKPINPNKQQESTWIREINGKSAADHIKSPEFEAEIEITSVANDRDDALFDEDIKQTSDEFGLELEDKETTEEIDLFEKSDLPHIGAIRSDSNVPSSVEGFVDISGMDFGKVDDETDLLPDAEPIRGGELPEWLQEMISETDQEPDLPKETLDASSKSNFYDQIDELDPVFLAEEASQVASYQTIDEPAFDDEILEPDDFDLEHALSIAKEDTTPVFLSATEEELSLPVEEIIAFEDSEVLPAPPKEELVTASDEDQLYQVKHYLDQDQIADALPIAQALIEKSVHLEQLETWFSEYSEIHPKSNESMEIIGDIGLKQNKPDIALKAYTKTLKLLLESHEDKNGIN